MITINLPLFEVRRICPVYIDNAYSVVLTQIEKKVILHCAIYLYSHRHNSHNRQFQGPRAPFQL